MITVGINENVVLQKVEITDKEKGTLAFTFRNALAEMKEEVSGFDALMADGYTETGDGSSLTIRLFPPLKPFDKDSKDMPISAADQQKSASESIAEKKNILFQILTTYMTSDKAKMDIYRNTGLTQENFNSRIIMEETLNKIFVNMAEDFVRLITPFLDTDATPVRLLLVCQSKTKHFADFRQRFVKDNPIIEPMAIPKEASKLKFTSYEIKNKLNDASGATQDAADKAEHEGELQTAASVFGANA